MMEWSSCSILSISLVTLAKSYGLLQNLQLQVLSEMEEMIWRETDSLTHVTCFWKH